MSLHKLLREDDELYSLYLNDKFIYNGLKSDSDLNKALINTVKSLGKAYNELFKEYLECKMKCPKSII